MLDELGDRLDRPDALVGLGREVQHPGDLERAVAPSEETLGIARKTGDQQFIAQGREHSRRYDVSGSES